MSKKIFLGAMIVFAAGVFAAATAPADLGALSGSVVGDDMTTPLAGAVVRVVNVADGREYVSRPIGPNGRFELAGIAEGRYAVTIISGGASFTLKERLYVKGRETGDLRMGLGRDRDTGAGIADSIIGGEMGRVTLGCVGPPKPPKPPKSKHKGQGHGDGHDDD
jgi:hypothetical protein